MSTSSIRLAFWNTWLLRPRLWSGGPRLLPLLGDRVFAPDVPRRAPLVGEALAGVFDVCALAEVFDEGEQDAVAAQWDEAEFQPGPGPAFPRRVGSGLMTLIDPERVTMTAAAHHTYRSGGDLRDADTYATKGALFTRIRASCGAEVDVVSTHLLAGGEWLPVPGANDHHRHHRARMAQVDELVAFVQHERDHANPLIVAGDFNVPAHDPRTPDDPTGPYRDLLAHLAPLEVVDLWAADGVGPGPTCSFRRGDPLPPDPAFPDAVLDEDGPPDGPGERIDYLFYAPPWRRSPTRAEVDRPRRWAFPGRAARGGPAGSLSDHLALSVTIHLRHR